MHGVFEDSGESPVDLPKTARLSAHQLGPLPELDPIMRCRTHQPESRAARGSRGIARACVSAARLAFQGRKSRVRAAFLEVLAAPEKLRNGASETHRRDRPPHRLPCLRSSDQDRLSAAQASSSGEVWLQVKPGSSKHTDMLQRKGTKKKRTERYPDPTAHRPPSHPPSSAMELHATPALMMAAPILLGVRPAGHPTREARVAVVDATLCMSHSMSEAVHVKVIAAMPRSRTSHSHVVTAPRLLVHRPSKVPVGETGIAVIVELRPGRWWCWIVLDDDMRRSLHVVGLVDHAGLRAHGHGHMEDVSRLMMHIPHVLDHHSVAGRVVRTSASILVAAEGLMRRVPEVLPIVESGEAIRFFDWVGTRSSMQVVIQEHASTHDGQRGRKELRLADGFSRSSDEKIHIRRPKMVYFHGPISGSWLPNHLVLPKNQLAEHHEPEFTSPLTAHHAAHRFARRFASALRSRFAARSGPNPRHPGWRGWPTRSIRCSRRGPCAVRVFREP